MWDLDIFLHNKFFFHFYISSSLACLSLFVFNWKLDSRPHPLHPFSRHVAFMCFIIQLPAVANGGFLCVDDDEGSHTKWPDWRLEFEVPRGTNTHTTHEDSKWIDAERGIKYSEHDELLFVHADFGYPLRCCCSSFCCCPDRVVPFSSHKIQQKRKLRRDWRLDKNMSRMARKTETERRGRNITFRNWYANRKRDEIKRMRDKLRFKSSEIPPYLRTHH